MPRLISPSITNLHHTTGAEKKPKPVLSILSCPTPRRRYAAAFAAGSAHEPAVTKLTAHRDQRHLLHTPKRGQ